ncbi:MAG: efflux RND transporter permease subunit [Firmicutes bacterium]|nr:efflux RND transporter permease subunit [Bacillota bacterium]
MLSKFSVKKPFTVFVCAIIVLVFGGVSMVKMTPDLFPEITTPYVMVMTTNPGASAEEVENQISGPMEQSLATLSNVVNITSNSSDNYSVIFIEFNADVNMDAISVDIRDKIDQVKGFFPESASTPVVMKMSMDMMPAVVAAITIEGKSAVETSQLYNEELESKLEGIEGVASVTPTGLVDSGIQIVLSQDKIDALNNKVSSKILSEMNDAKSKIKGGISKVKSGDKKIKKGKEDIKDGYTQITSSLSMMKSNKKQLEQQLADLEAQDPRDEEAIALVKAQINALVEAIDSLEDQKDEMGFDLGTTYSDLSATQATLQSTLSQLQSSLTQVEDAKDAAIDAADLTGVITMENVSSILSAQNFSMPAGYVSDGKADLLVSVGDKLKDEDEIRNLILFDLDIDGIDPIRVSDVATVAYVADDSNTYAKINGENAVIASLTKQSNYATATVADNITKKFEQLSKEYDGIKFDTLIDQGEYIHVVINSVIKNLILGGILAILILLFFLRDIRPTVITAISIPVSVIFAIALMYFTGVTLNMISLSGLAIAIGMLVDNSIVVIENIYRLRSMGYSVVQAAVSGAGQVAGAVTASTLTTICVFAPIVFVSGMTREIFTDLALTIAYSLVASLIIALTLVPAMAKGMLVKTSKHKTVLGQGGRVIKTYKKIAAWSLDHKKRVLAGALALLIASTGFLLVKGLEFMPEMSSYQVSAGIKLPEYSTIDQTIAVNDEIINEIQKVDGVETVGVILSSGVLNTMTSDSTNTDVTQTTIYAVLDVSKAKNSKKVEKLIKQIGEEKGCEVTISSSDMTSMMAGAGVSMDIFCDDLDTLRTTAAGLEERMRHMEALEEVSDVNEDSTDELHIVVNKNKAMRKGLTVAQVYQQVAAKLAEEKKATTLTKEGSTVDVSIENTTKDKFTRNDLENMRLTISKKDGTTEKVKLTSVASINDDASLNTIKRLNQNRTLSVSAKVKEGYNVTKVTREVKEIIENENLIPDDVDIDYGGENEEIMKAMRQMILLMLVGFVLVYLVMVAQFQSLRSPFIIIFTIPLAFTGGMLALIICNQVLSVVAMMGFVMLMGIVVNNAIVLVDTINRFRLNGMDRDEAIITAGAVRMRPVMMTAATTVLGLMPIAIGIGNGAEMVQPVAIVCIGGLIYATLTTLVVVPIMYRLLSKKKMVKIEDEELEIITA